MQKTTLQYCHLDPEAELPVLEGLSAFKAIVMVEADVPEMTRWDISRWLIESGCKFALTWGKDAVLWAESVDDASLEATDYEDVGDEDLVMTTSHEDDDLSEVFWFSQHRATHPAFELNETLIVHIAEAPRRDEIEAEFHDA